MVVSLHAIVTRYQAIGKLEKEYAGAGEAPAIALPRRAAKARGMTAHDCDIVIVGGGLAGGLIALALARLRPDIGMQVLESGPVAGGNHRWSWFDSDLSDDSRRLLDGFATTRWDEGYDVRFPGFARTLATPYRSLSSRDFAEALARRLPAGAIRTAIISADGGEVLMVRVGEFIGARYKVQAIGADSVELADLTTGVARRLALR